MDRFIAVAFGGALGAMLRYGIALFVSRLFEGPAPIATWIANMAGCLLIGFLVPAMSHETTSVTLRAFVLVGFLGSLTTFSTFSYESIVLWQEQETFWLIANAVGSLVVGLLLVWAGMRLYAAMF